MSVLPWVMMGLAIWHFTVYVPDRFWGGIVGAFISAIIGACIFGYIVNGLEVPNSENMDIVQAFIAVPGTLIGLALCYYIGVRREAAAETEDAA